MNDDYSKILFTIAVFIGLGIIVWIIETISNSIKYKKLKPQFNELESSIKKHKANVSLWNEDVQRDKEAIQIITNQRSMCFPWLAEAYADYFSLKDLRKEEYLKHKSHPAYTAAETVKVIRNEKKILVQQKKIIEYKINYYEKLFPWLIDLIAEDENEEIPVKIDTTNQDEEEDEEDSVKNWLTQEEYRALPTIERNQKALDRYLESRNKSKWSLGRDYEMYIGYLYEQNGYSVEYKGIIDGFDDLGRDIIAKNDKETCIIQCKYWAQYKELHEKHIFQLFGTTMEYWIRNFGSCESQNKFNEFTKYLNEKKLRPIFVCSTKLSDRAKEMADVLNVKIVENYPLGNFPRIKCNTNYNEFREKTKIYHLPMDQQYDRTIVTKNKGEFYAFTVKEAEDAGFRRAFRHNYKDKLK
ncbi:MAG: restriction endonuclease [Deltaproteobacteria bacterium]|nr:restriction endonuclease [Deltaproteobacteria bacterium]